MNNILALPYSQLSWRKVQTYELAFLFVVGNIVLPQLCHLVPGGGLVWLPIYFFTLIAAYRYGLQAGLITAIASPIVNHFLFGMPPSHALPVILAKSMILAVVASLVARRVGKATWLSLIVVVLAYQVIGGVVEGFLTSSITAPLQDFLVGWRGMLLQVAGGWLILNKVLNY